MLQLLVPILISAFIGVFIGVLFEEPLTRLKENTVIYCKRIFYPRHKHVSNRETFSFGSQKTTWLVLDGDGEDEYEPQAIRTHFDSQQESLPEDLAKRKQQIQQQEEENLQKGQPYYWNGERFSFDRFIITRDELEENLALELWFKPSDYYTFLATNMSAEEESLRKKYLQTIDWLTPPRFFSNAFAVYILVITSDNCAIITQRSKVVGSRPGAYNISVNEGLSKSLDRSTGGHAPNLYRCASRGVAEELGLKELDDFKLSDIVFISFGVDTEYLQYGVVGMLKINKTAEEMMSKRAAGIKDKWENTQIHLVPFEPDAIIPFVFSHDPWAPGGLVCIYHTLVHEFQSQKVDNALQRYLKKYTKTSSRIDLPQK